MNEYSLRYSRDPWKDSTGGGLWRGVGLGGGDCAALGRSYYADSEKVRGNQSAQAGVVFM